MLKLLDSASFFKEQDQQVTILNLEETASGLEKVAADSRISDFVSQIKPKLGKCYLHINAMGAGEYYGANRNGDYFPEAQLIEYYKTFETSPAHLFRHHINKDPARANGVVIFSIYNERMHRVELVVEADKSLVQDVESRILMGDYPATSMACKTPYDVCSICGNKAHSTKEYCTHLKNELGRVYPDGRKVMALNLGPLRFFDISIVIRPADITSSVLQKVANEVVLGSAEAALLEELGEREKTAEMKKISELIKNITDGVVVGASDNLNNILNKVGDLPEHIIPNISVFPLHEIFGEMANLGISPSIGFLAELIAYKTLGKDYQGIGKIVEYFIKHVNPETEAPVVPFEPVAEPNPFVRKVLMGYVGHSSLLPEFIEKRASGIGYFGLGPTVEPLPVEELGVDLQPEKEDNSFSKNLKILLGLGGAALLAKAYISHQIDNKLKQDRNSVKISIVKIASDYKLAGDLSRASMTSYNQDHSENSSSISPQRVLSRLIKGFFKNRMTPEAANKVSVVLTTSSLANQLI